MRKGFVVLLYFTILVLMTSCGGSSGSGGGDGNTSPVAQITTPAQDSLFYEGDVIQFSGNCSDSEDGDLNGRSLKWWSDLHGSIGTGEACPVGTLMEGPHHIELRCFDAEGAVGIDTIRIRVIETPVILPDTGQTTSYTDTFGEDSDYSIRPPAYTKLDAAGNALDVGATDWTMVRDDVTGLTWEVKIRNGQGLHDRNNQYTWQEAQDFFVAQLNSDNFGGHSDWRLPTVKELSSLIHADVFDPAINAAYFPHSVPSAYWSSTTFTIDTDRAWIVEFNEGIVDHFTKLHSLCVRAVRGIQFQNNSTRRLMNHFDGTVIDRTTGLMWQQAEAGAMIWEEALTYCETLKLAGHDDWRLPNRSELQSIVDYEVGNPSTSTYFFPGAMSLPYWSSTTFTSDIGTGHAWVVNFLYGGLESNYYNVQSLVRAVRDGTLESYNDNVQNHERAVRGEQ